MSKFSEIISGNQPVLVDFYADWCGPCKVMAPILKKVKGHFGDQIKIIKIDVDKNQALAAQYQIRSIPTLILFKNKQVLWKQPSVLQENELIEQINRFSN